MHGRVLLRLALVASLIASASAASTQADTMPNEPCDRLIASVAGRTLDAGQAPGQKRRSPAEATFSVLPDPVGIAISIISENGTRPSGHLRDAVLAAATSLRIRPIATTAPEKLPISIIMHPVPRSLSEKEHLVEVSGMTDSLVPDRSTRSRFLDAFTFADCTKGWSRRGPEGRPFQVTVMIPVAENGGRDQIGECVSWAIYAAAGIRPDEAEPANGESGVSRLNRAILGAVIAASRNAGSSMTASQVAAALTGGRCGSDQR